MKYKILISLLACSLLNISLYSQRVTTEQALKIASDFLVAQDRGYEGDLSAEPTPFKILSLGKNDTTMYAISTMSDWVLISGDLRVTPILAYSDNHSGSFPSIDDMPPAMIDLIDWYDSQIAYIRDNSINRDTHPAWSAIQNNISMNRSVIVEPLLYRNGLENKWGQSGNNNNTDTTKYYNKFCPPKYTSLENCSHTIVGCVAVATSQVLWYWQWPYSAIVKDDNANKILRQYDWSLMPTRLTSSSTLSEANMVATLLHDVGVSVEMDYGCSLSSAYSSKIDTALRNTYHYIADDLRYRSSFLNLIWIQLLKSDLNSGRPILYAGTRSESRSHQFVLDGYNSDNKFHVNYGWKGTANGYYLLDSISNNGDPYIYYQTAILNIHPDYPSCNSSSFSSSDVNENPFEIYGGNVVSSVGTTINSGKTGLVYAGQMIQLLPPFSILSGANVHLAIKDMHCIASTLNYQSGLVIEETDTIDNGEPERFDLPASIEIYPSENDNVPSNADGKTYNLLGQPVDENYHGIVIQNGQKRVQ